MQKSNSEDEQERLTDLVEYEILDTAVERIFDTMTALACQICDTPISLLVFIDKDRQWFKSSYGIPDEFQEMKETSKEISFCAQTILEDEMMEISDLSVDSRFLDNPFVKNNPYVRFYAGVPLQTKRGNKIGTICVLDNKPRTLTFTQKQHLKDISFMVMEILETRRQMRELSLLRQHNFEMKQSLVKQEIAAAEKANRIKSEFLSAMSHEIRTPLNAVVGVGALLESTPLNEEQKDYLKMIKTSSDILLSVINDVLDFSKIEAHQVTLEQIDFNLLELAEDVLDLFALKAKEKKLDLWLDFAEDVPVWVKGDSFRIRQILTNLISNAIKFTAKGSVSLAISQTPEGVSFEVRDTGIGISKSGMQKLFKPFSQADESISRMYGGTGLGLAICAQIVKAMGNEIQCKSKLGEGSSFYFTINFQKCLTLKHDIRSDCNFLPANVLCINDSIPNKKTIQARIKHLNLGCDTAKDCATAWSVLNSDPKRYSLIILNINSSEEAYSFINRLRHSADFKNLPVVLVVSYDCIQAELDKTFSVLNVNGFLKYPVRQQKLHDVLKTTLKHES